MFGFFRKGFPRGPFPRPAEFEKLRELFFLWLIDQGDGITGYQLKGVLNVPQTSVYRGLADLEARELVRVEETIADGRVQKRYYLTDNGRVQLEELKRSVAGKITFLFDMIAPDLAGETVRHPMRDRIEILKSRLHETTSKEETLQYLDHFQEISSSIAAGLAMAVEKSNAFESAFAQIRAAVETMEEYDADRVVEIFDDFTKQIFETSETNHV